jgi:chaperonin GroES
MLFNSVLTYYFIALKHAYKNNLHRYIVDVKKMINKKINFKRGRQIMKIKPLFDRVILQPKKAKTQTVSGLILPESAQEKSNIATVIAVGDGITEGGEKTTMAVGVGQSVLYTKYAGSEVQIDGENYIIIKQTDIVAILNI